MDMSPRKAVASLVVSLALAPASAQYIDADVQRLFAPDAAPVNHAVTAAPYFAERIDLGALPTMIAVYADPALRNPADLGPALRGAGLSGATVHASTVPGWSYIMMPRDGGTLASAELAVMRLAARADLDTASLVYLGRGGLPEIPTRDLLIQFAEGATAAERDALLAAHGAVIIERDAAGTAGLVRARTGLKIGGAILDAALALNDHPAVEWAQSDRIFWARRMGGPPNDPMFAQQWALEQASDEDMDALTAWSITSGDPSVRVVVLDSGTQQNHPDISQVAGQTFTGSSSNGDPGNACDNHGTAVAGCVAATMNNGIGIAGIAPDARVQAAKIFNEVNFLGLFCLPFLESQDSWTAAGINWAASSGAHVTNSSWGGGSPSAAITNAFDSTRAQGVLHFAAAGNDGTSTVSYPASLASISAVAALDSSGNRASFSTFGAGLFISAPGAAILTTDRTGSAGYGGSDYTTIDGTSFASPYAAGVAALVLSANPALTPAEVESILAQTAVDKGPAGYDTGYGWGFINAGAAVQAAAGNPCTADLAEPFGVLDLADIQAFTAAFIAGDPLADLAAPTGVFDLADIQAFTAAFIAGCP
jgi:subtilisin family serine protease